MTINTKCRICPDGSAYIGRYDPKMWPQDTSLTPLLDLGEQPLADRFLSSPNDPEPVYPLQVGICSVCWCVQQTTIVPDSLLFGNDYAFYTGGSPSSIPYFAQYAKDVLAAYPEQAKGLVVEIAGNDGTLLKHFQDAGCRVLNIEPTANTAKVAQEAGIETLVTPFSFNLAVQKMGDYPKASLMLANNVLAHVDKLHDFIAGISHLLAEDGVAIIEVQYLPHLLFKNAFDHVYHEHRSFFSLTALQEIFGKYTQLVIVDVQEADTQGGSIRFTLRHDPWRKLIPSERVTAMLADEHRLGIDGIKRYTGMQARVDRTKEQLVPLLRRLKAQGKTIYGYGASAKGNTLLNTCGIGPELLDCIVDTTPFKIGKYAPGSHIPVVGPGERPEPDYYLLLVWNYMSGVLKREQPFRDAGGHFIVPIPAPIVI